MNTRFKFSVVFTILICLQPIYSQVQTRAGFLPSINYNHKINKIYEVNFKLESRHVVFEDNTSQDDHFKYRYSLTDISALMGRKVGLNSKVILGVLTRIETNDAYLRTIQQFIFQAKINDFRVVHRIVADQTFSSTESTEFRLRYRLSSEIPLSGLKADVKEFYFKLNSELLNSLQENEYDIELRVVPSLGYVINERQKIEMGLDNRIVSFIDNQTRFATWITINWFL